MGLPLALTPLLAGWLTNNNISWGKSMIADLFKHIDKDLLPHTGAGTMALYIRDKLREVIKAPSGILQLDDEHPAALQLIIGSDAYNMNIFIEADGTMSQVVVDQGEAGPTSIFIPHEKHPDQITEQFIFLMAMSLYPPVQGRL